ncbi:AAA family ATPase [Sphingomonas sp. AR_OL41]|uniref:AAA family ATPase n=1 Tax=Sphingomonas sp. AR_OL41 TaxID=3042729 RepID=UPI00248055EA|nr:AAA family ATPase [Sphingomonas sp. AR_OL41]MDH7972862.1 AAA family ATPase [Sphingomonas sp. AR_OL41]
MDLSGYRLEKIQETSGFILYRARAPDASDAILVRAPISQASDGTVLSLLERELAIRASLDHDWALLPGRLVRYGDRPALTLRDPGGSPFEVLVGKPCPVSHFLRHALGITSALEKMHARGLIHRDIKPANLWLDGAGRVRLTGFGFATRRPQDRQPLGGFEEMVGSLEYMAPEQTGRTNRTVDSRSDLYALGVTLYELLVGALPFNAVDQADWFHCHIAREPSPPSMRIDGVPPLVEAIILKLLAKDTDDRYQTAAGIRYDLQRCLDGLRGSVGSKDFAIGSRDRPERLVITEKLYGRDQDIRMLVEAFDHVAKHRQFELVLVAGQSGIGKSALVNEFRRTLFARNALFANGKFDQYKQDVPLATLSEAFEGLLKQILTRNDRELARWRSELRAALGPNGLLMADLFPSIQLVIGEMPPLAEVSPQEARNRFRLVFRRFVSVFAQPDHPLVLFLDDLQWLDAATLELLEQLGSEEPIPNLLLIGAYRRQPRQPSAALENALARISNAHVALKRIDLSPLSLSEVASLAADALRSTPAAVAPLAELMFAKTQGNPFFVIQFLKTIHADGLIDTDGGTERARFDLGRIRAADITGNVAELMVAKLGRYEVFSVSVAMLLACIGTAARTELLASVLEITDNAVEEALQGFVDDSLLLRSDDGFTFAHDSVREAAYALMSQDQRALAHLRIGRRLAARLATGEADEDIFAIVGQFNRGVAMIGSPAERLQVANLNLEAGRRAIAAAAYETALGYLEAGCALLSPEGWGANYRINFELEFHRTDCLFMAGEVNLAEEQLADLATRSTSMADYFRVVSRQIVVYSYLGQLDKAVVLAVDCAARLGQSLPEKPDPAALEEEYEAFVTRLGGRPIEALFDLPGMTDPHWLQVMDVLESLITSAGIHREDLQVLTILRMANISLDHGLAHESAHIFSNLGGLVIGWRFGDFASAHQFGRLALRLADERGFDRYASRIYAVVSGTVGPWSLPLRDCFELSMRALEMGREQGGVTYAGYAWSTALSAALDGGKGLSEVHRLADVALVLMKKMKFSLAIEFVNTIILTVRALRGMTASLGSFAEAGFDEQAHQAFLEHKPHLWHALVRHRVRKLQLLFHAGDYAACSDLEVLLSSDIEKLKVFERAEYCLFSALAGAARLTELPRDARDPHLATIIAAHRQLAQWAALCPENFSCRASLVAAEIARLQDRDLDAQRFYEEAIHAAAEEGLVSVEALAYELAAKYYGAREFRTICQTYMRNARACYARWRADGKVAQLDLHYPELGRENTGRAASALSASAISENLDLSALVEIYQTVSGEIVLDRLIEQLMITVVEQAGAVRGVLLLPRAGEMRIAAEAVTGKDRVAVIRRSYSGLAGELPISVLNYVVRSLEPLILDDALQPNTFSADVYLLASKPRSILCLPLVKQGQLVAILYLENALSSHVFTPSRLAILQMLSSPAAISIENARLFLEAQEARDKARRANDELQQSFDMIPTLAWRALPDGAFEIANKKWKEFSGQEAIPEARDAWPGTYHPDDVGHVEDRWQNLLSFGVSGEIEARIRRFDGEFRRFLFRVEPMRDETGAIVKWYGTAMDIEDFRRAEQAQEALARVSRITALGELSVSIAHEVNQPLMAIVTNAATCVRWLGENNLNVPEARRAAERIINEGHRAGDVIASIRALAKKAAPQMVALDLNDAILEVVQLMRNELDRNAITVETRLAENLNPALADRVQMQQVILNLVMNGIEAMSMSSGRVRKLRIESRVTSDGELTISVSDTGRGLDPALKDRIFEAFFTTKDGGIGMGLSICRSIIEAHRGRLSVTANKPRGTTFAFILPAVAEERAIAVA